MNQTKKYQKHERVTPKIGMGLVETAKYIGTSPQTLSRMIEEGTAPPYRELTKGRKVWSKQAIESWFLQAQN